MQNWRWTAIGTNQHGVIKADSGAEAYRLLQNTIHQASLREGVSLVHITDDEADELWRRESKRRTDAAAAFDVMRAYVVATMTKPRCDGALFSPVKVGGGSRRNGWWLSIAMTFAVVLALVFPGQAGLLIAAAIAALCVVHIVPE